MENIDFIKGWILFVISPAILAVSVLVAIISGNDKAPFLVLVTIGMIGIIFVITGINLLLHRTKNQAIKSLFLGSVITLLYVVIVVLFSRAGLVDSMLLLGFR